MSRKALGFDAESSNDEDDVNSFENDWRTAKKNAGSKKSPYLQQRKQKEEEAIDESIYAYDEVYDDVSHASKVESTRKARSSGPQYIGGLIEAKNRRKEDKVRITDLKMAKERELEGDEFKDKEVFVTTAYKEHREKMTEKEKSESQAKAPVDMTEFHKNMMNDDKEFCTSKQSDDRNEDQEIPEESHKPLQTGLNITSKSATTPWQPFKKQKTSRQSETDSVLKQIEALEEQKQKDANQSTKKSRLLPRLSDTELDQYRSRYLQRKAASV